MARSVVTPERLAKGRTFDEYLKYVGSPENLVREAFGGYFPDGGSVGAPRKDNSAVFRERYARARLSDYQKEAIKWLAAQPGGPAKILVISEDWSSDCRRDVPMLARLAEEPPRMRTASRAARRCARRGRSRPIDPRRRRETRDTRGARSATGTGGRLRFPGPRRRTFRPRMLNGIRGCWRAPPLDSGRHGRTRLLVARRRRGRAP